MPPLFCHRNGVALITAPVAPAKDVDWTPIFAKELNVQAAFAHHHADHFGAKGGKALILPFTLWNVTRLTSVG